MKNNKPTLAAVPDLPNEVEDDSAPDEQPKGYTLADQFKRNADLIREAADATEIDPEALVALFTTTMNVHFTKIQLGLVAPVEG